MPSNLLLLLLAGASFAGTPDAAADAPPVEQLRDVTLPRMAARGAAAKLVVEVRQGYFAGERSWDEAFPGVDAGSIARRSVLQGRLRLLDDAQAARLAERVARREALDAATRTSLDSALDAEDQADALERRLLLGVRALIDARPELEADALAVVRAPWIERVARGAPPEDEPGLREVARADQANRALSQLLTALVRQATVPGAPAPSPDADLALLSTDQAPAAMQRLELIAPALAPVEQARVRAAQVSWFDASRLPELRAKLASADSAPPPQGSLEQLRAALRDARATVARAEAAAAKWDGETPYSAARSAEVALQTQLTQRSVSALEASVAAAEAAAEVAARSTEANAEAERAQVRAEQARREAQAALDRALTERRVQAGERAAEAWRTTSARAADQSDGLAALLRTLSGLAAEVEDGAAPLDKPDAAPRPLDAVYVDLRAFTARAEAAVDAARDAVASAESEVAASLAVVALERARASSTARSADTATRAEQETSIVEWTAALDDEQRALEARLMGARDTRDASLRVLHDAKALRRDLKASVSRAVRADDHFAQELQRELVLLPSTAVAMSRDRIAWFAAMPSRLTDLGFIWGLLVGGSESLVLLMLGAAGLRATPAWAHMAARFVAARNPGFAERDLVTALPAAERVARAAVMLVVGWLLLGPLSQGVPEVSAVLALALYFVLWRALDEVFALAVVPRSRLRPALRVMTDHGYEVARWSVRVLTAWWVVRSALGRLLLAELGLDATYDLSQAVLRLVGIGLLIVLLGRWEPFLRSRLAALPSHDGVTKLLAAPPARSVLAPLWGFATGSILLLRGAWGLLHDQAERRERFGQVFNVVTRYRFSKTVSAEPREPLAVRHRDVLCAAVCAPRSVVPRDAADASIEAAFAAWERESRRGMVALLGDRGDGKRTWLAAQEAKFVARGYTVQRLQLRERITASAELYAWLAEALNVPLASTDEQMAASLRQLPRAVYILDGAHFAFLRAVGGFDALRSLLYLLNASSEERFWIAVFHRPAWRYLQRLPVLIDVGVFRDEIDLAPMNEHMLRRVCDARVRELGLTASFERLVRPSALGGPPDIELERTIKQFFRLLADASGGNPAVALGLFADSLALTPAGQLEVHMVDALASSWLEGLHEHDLFTLVALRVQDALDERELVHVTNVSPSRVRATVKLLQAKGLLEPYHGRLRITEAQLPAVTRTLRRRHFLQWAV